MMKSLITTLIFFVCWNSLFSQVTLNWLDPADGPSQSAGSVAVDNSLNSYGAAVGGEVTYLTKRNKSGVTLWMAADSTSYLEGIVKVFVDPQGHPVVTGFQYYNTINGKVVVGMLVREFSAAGNLLYKQIIPGFYTNLDGGDIEHPGNNQSKVSAAMDKTGSVYLATGGEVSGGGIGFNLVKVSNAGTLLHKVVNNFGLDTTSSASPFYLVENVSVKNNKVGLTGTTKIGFQNISTWVTDTAGVTLWSDISTGIEGKDIAFDNTGNAYIAALKINAASPFSSDDITLLKFNPSGSKLFTKSYDFGGAEIPIRLLVTNDNKIAIMGSGTGTSTLFFSDWLIVKLSTAGAVLWNYRYNQSNYDEQPRAMVQDAKSNLYITGSGGPDTGDFLYGLYGVTIRLNTAGKEKWISKIHLQNFTPVDLNLGKDTSVFVISAPQAAVARLLQKSKSTICAVPTNLQAAVTNNSAVLSWKAVPDVFLYQVQYKTSTAAEWTEIMTDSTHYTAHNLLQGTSYDFRVQAICAVGPSGWSVTKTFVTTGAGYCASSGATFNNSYMINWVALGDIYNQSSAEGYGDFTSQSTVLLPGSTYSLSTAAYVIGDFYNEAFSVWIDYNIDGDFTDAGELVAQFTQSTTGYTVHSFTVPTSVTLGVTRMRVSMKHGGYSTPCEIFQNGEVEDYTINLGPAKASNVFLNEAIDLSVMPNPANDLITVHADGFADKFMLRIYDVSGKLIIEQNERETNIGLDISSFPAGIYVVHVTDDNGNSERIKFVKE